MKIIVPQPIEIPRAFNYSYVNNPGTSTGGVFAIEKITEGGSEELLDFIVTIIMKRNPEKVTVVLYVANMRLFR